MSDPVGVVLAAGLATRMGRPKQLLPYRNGSVLGAVLGAARVSRLRRVVVVLGAYEQEIRRIVPLGDVSVVVNPEPHRGNLSSLLTAATVTGGAPILLLMGDMPGVAPEVIDLHLDAWSAEPAWLRTTTYANGVGHPFMLSPDVVAKLDELAEPRPLWSLTQDGRAETLRVECDMPADIDTPDDYRDALAQDQGQ